MFLVTFLPSMGKYHLMEFTLFNLLIKSLVNPEPKESIIELPQSSLDTGQEVDKLARMRNLTKWRDATVGFRS